MRLWVGPPALSLSERGTPFCPLPLRPELRRDTGWPAPQAAPMGSQARGVGRPEGTALCCRSEDRAMHGRVEWLSAGSLWRECREVLRFGRHGCGVRAVASWGLSVLQVGPWVWQLPYVSPLPAFPTLVTPSARDPAFEERLSSVAGRLSCQGPRCAVCLLGCDGRILCPLSGWRGATGPHCPPCCFSNPAARKMQLGAPDT